MILIIKTPSRSSIILFINPWPVQSFNGKTWNILYYITSTDEHTFTTFSRDRRFTGRAHVPTRYHSEYNTGRDNYIKYLRQKNSTDDGRRETNKNESIDHSDENDNS